MVTTIQISKELLNKLQGMKFNSKESYEEIIWDLIEDRMELSEETKKGIAEYKKTMKESGMKKFKTLDKIKEELS